MNWAFFLVAVPIGAALGGLLGVATAVTCAAWAGAGLLAALLWTTRSVSLFARGRRLKESWEAAS
jgi:hypothetical protein